MVRHFVGLASRLFPGVELAHTSVLSLLVKCDESVSTIFDIEDAGERGDHFVFPTDALTRDYLDLLISRR